jgi:hypothetical protein
VDVFSRMVDTLPGSCRSDNTGFCLTHELMKAENGGGRTCLSFLDIATSLPFGVSNQMEPAEWSIKSEHYSEQVMQSVK